MKTNPIFRAGTTSLALAAAFAAQAMPQTQRDLTQGNTLYVVPYAHLDTQWRWAYPQVIQEYIANTLTRNFALIDKYPHYVFNFSGSRRYEMMKEYYPADYLKLKGYIEAGRWFPCGSSVDEGDANIPSAESLVRHVLYGNRYFRHEFGVASHEFMLPDCFGFPYSLPSILAHCGVKGFSTQKLTWGSAVGIPFKVGVWQGPDGKSVVAALDPGAYSASVSEDLSQNTTYLARIQHTGQLSGAFVDYHYYGTGDTGGAPRESSVQWIEKSIAGSGPVSVVSAKADAMFDAITPAERAKLPVYRGELLLTNHSAGSISSQAYMKRSNRKSELLADAAEKSSVAAMLFGSTPYPSDRLYHAWDLLLGSQMHDMLPGTSIPKAYEFCWNDFLLSQNQFAAVESDAVGAVSKQMDTRGKGVPLLIYNPLSISREDVVEATIPDISHGGSVSVTTPSGEENSAQILSRSGDALHIAFEAKVPATGFASYAAHSSSGMGSKTLHIDSRHIENARFRVTVNDAGDISSIFDKRANREVMKAPSRLEMQYENPGQFPAWNMDWDDAKLPPRDVVGGPAKFRIVENGPVRVSLEVERQAKGSKFVQDIRLSAGGERVEVLNTIDWKTRERALKASFPLTSGNPEASYDLQLGTTVRGNNDSKKFEVPQHQWFDLTNPSHSYGVGILNDSKFGSDKPSDDTVRLTLIYTPGIRGGFEDQATQDFGRHKILYAIAPHSGDWRKGEVPWQAQRLNQPLRSFLVDAHRGPLGKSFSLLSTSSDQVEVQALKKAEDGGEVVVRLRELNGSEASNVKLKFARPVLSAREVNGQEMPLGPIKVVGGQVVVDVPAYSLKAIAVKLAPSPVSGPLTVSKPIALRYDLDVVSSDAHPADGTFAQGRALSAEQFPTTLAVDDIQFKFGPKTDGFNNAVLARGQSIPVPAGYSRVYLIAAADTDATDAFKIGKTAVVKTIQGWRNHIGEWDNRQWSVDPGPNFGNYGDNMNGLTPGYVKPSEVAWFASHCHVATGNTFYDYSYLYKYGFDVPAGATSITLPNDPRIKVLAVSVAKSGHDEVRPAQPLFDTLADHTSNGAPLVTPAGGSFSDATEVRIEPPLYYHAGGTHYTVDGSTPTASSPLYTGPFTINDPTTVKVVQVDENGHLGPITTATLQVHDTTAPKIVDAEVAKELGIARVTFSEPISRSSAEDISHYKLSPAGAVASAQLDADRRTVELTLDGPITTTDSVKLTVDGVQDLAKTPNVTSATMDVSLHGAVFTSPALEPKTGRVFSNVQGMPVHPTDPWTLNFFCKIDQQPEDRTLIAGFGTSIDRGAGLGRYFTKFPDGISFWVADRDVTTHVPLDTDKWQMLTATYDGATMRLYKDGIQIAEQKVPLDQDGTQIRVMPLDAWDRKRRFGGEVRDLTMWDMPLPAAAVKRLWEAGNHP